MQLLELEEFVEVLDTASERFEKATFERPLKECAQEIRQGFAENFADKAGADGVGWPARKATPQDDGHPLLIDTGALLLATTSPNGRGHVEDVGQDELVIGVDGDEIPYAGVHQHGSLKKNIPQRQYVYGRAERLDQCGEILADYGATMV